MTATEATCRHLVLVLGDQLCADSAAFDGFRPGAGRGADGGGRDESTHVWSHKARTTLFLSAMRHFAAALAERGYR